MTKTETPTGSVNSTLLASYGKAIEDVHEVKLMTIAQTEDIEIAFMREGVASGLSVRDLQATLKAGQDKAKANGYKVLPDLGVGKVSAWTKALALLDNLGEQEEINLPRLLNVAWNSSRLPEGYKPEGKTLDEIESDIPARKDTNKGDKPHTDRKGKNRAVPTLTQLAEIVEQVAESLPEDLSTLSEFDIVAIAKIAQKFASIQRAVKKAA